MIRTFFFFFLNFHSQNGEDIGEESRGCSSSSTRVEIERNSDMESNMENGSGKKSGNEDTWTDVNLNDEGDVNNKNVKNMSLNHVHGMDNMDGNMQGVVNERGEKPKQEISVVRIPSEYHSSHSTSSPEDLAIKVKIYFIWKPSNFFFFFPPRKIIKFLHRIWSIIFPFPHRQEKHH